MVLRIVLTLIIANVLIIPNKTVLRPKSIKRYVSIILGIIFVIFMIESDYKMKRRMEGKDHV